MVHAYEVSHRGDLPQQKDGKHSLAYRFDGSLDGVTQHAGNLVVPSHGVWHLADGLSPFYPHSVIHSLLFTLGSASEGATESTQRRSL